MHLSPSYRWRVPCAMLLQGQPAPNRTATSLATAVTAAATRKNSAADGTKGGSLLSEKMKDMAAVQAAARSSDKASWKALKIGERRAAWDKTGVLALRDMQLIEIQQDWLEGNSCDIPFSNR